MTNNDDRQEIICGEVIPVRSAIEIRADGLAYAVERQETISTAELQQLIRAMQAAGLRVEWPMTNLPRSIMFFPNGTAAVFDHNDRQSPRYQRGWHGTTIEALAADGINWRDIPDRLGSPMASPPSWWSAERQARQDTEDMEMKD